MPSNEVLAQLDQAVLDSVLTGRPLPGGVTPVLPDLGFIRRQPAILVAKEGLAGTLSGEALPQPLRIVSRNDIQTAESTSDTAYLQFHNEILSPDEISVVLEGRISSPSSGQGGLISVRVIFHQRDGKWEAAGDPAVLAE